MSEVYAACVDQLLINLARHFQFIKDGAPIPGSWDYTVRKLAEMDAVTRESEQIILSMLGDADESLRGLLEEAIRNGLKDAEPALKKAAEKGLTSGVDVPNIAPRQMQAFQYYYEQSADKLNLVNTVMLESTEQAYAATVADISAKISNTQGILNTSTGQIITGTASFNKVQRDAVRRMVDNGITGYIDHGGHHWSPEAYVAMDMRTTMTNTAREAVWEQSDSVGCDLYQVSWHDGARPLCYPWQGKVISRNGWTGEVEDGEGNTVTVHSESEIESFRYGGGLFGVNCGHYPIPFFPGFSRMRPPQQNEEENAKEYAESQQQRALERKVREEKRELEVMKAQGATKEELDAQKIRVRNANANLTEFCDKTGRARQPGRTSAPINATFPDGYQQTRHGAKKAPQTPTPAPATPVQSVLETKIDQAVQTETFSTNIFGEAITYSEKMDDPKWNESKRTINTLASEFKTKLKTVSPGAHQAAGDVQISGTVMRLSSKAPSDAVHEFAHTISLERQTKYGIYEESEFWKEIKATRRAYMKAVENDPANWISSYEHSGKDIDEFMAEGFALGYMREKGMKIPEKYGNDSTYSSMVLNIVKKYFGK